MKAYLGDAVYVTVERGMLRLTTEDGLAATNVIFLEVPVYRALQKFVESLPNPIGWNGWQETE